MKSSISLALLMQLAALLLGCGGGGGRNGSSNGGGTGAVAPSIATQPADQRVVVGTVATFSVMANGTAPLSYQWQKGQTPISGATASSYTTPAVALSDDGATFQVVVSNSAGVMTSSAAKLTVAAGTTQARGIDVTTSKNDLNRSGQNLSESTLTLSNVAPASFGLLRLLPVDGKVDAQPLYLSQLSAAGGSFNIVFVATEHDSVYAFDSDSGAILWRASVAAGQRRICRATCAAAARVIPEIGITSTPVIDRSAGPNGTIYVVAMSIDKSEPSSTPLPFDVDRCGTAERSADADEHARLQSGRSEIGITSRLSSTHCRSAATMPR